MTAILLSLFAGVVAHKLWRVAWAVRSGSKASASVRREFAPADLQSRQPRRDRPRSVTEVGV